MTVLEVNKDDYVIRVSRGTFNTIIRTLRQIVLTPQADALAELENIGMAIVSKEQEANKPPVVPPEDVSTETN